MADSCLMYYSYPRALPIPMEEPIAWNVKHTFGVSERHVRLGVVGYYADFVIHPTLVLALGALALSHATAPQGLAWLGVAAIGVLAWTLVEYLLHRFVLHRVAFFDSLHNLHHTTPTAMVGTPSWMSLAFVSIFVLAPCCLVLGVFLGSAATAGFLVGYFWCICVHHISHHWRVDHRSYLYAAKRHHAQHHHSNQQANFGVTSPAWDWLFGSRHAGK